MNKPLLLAVATVVWALILSPTHAHRSGCHTLHTCPSDTNTYACGDLGYQCDGSSSVNDIAPQSVNVPLLVSTVFQDIFGREIAPAESSFWKARYRSDKNSLTKIRRAMRWHAAGGTQAATTPTGSSKKPEKTDLTPRINAIFRSVHHGRNPTPSENAYWISRLKDKPYEAALIGAMTWHRNHNIQH